MGSRAFAISAAVVTVAGAAQAQAQSRRAFRIEVTLPAGCDDIFTREFLSKTRSIDIDASAASALRVKVERVKNAFVGTLEIALEPSVLARSLESERCEDVVRGLALMAAVTVDPPIVPTDAGDAGERVSTSAPRQSDDAAVPPPTPSPSLPPERHASMSTGAGASSELTFIGLGPSLFVGGYGELAARDDGRAPRLRMRLGGSLPVRATSRSASASLQWLLATAEACPLGFGLVEGSLFARPCAGFDAGLVLARGEGSALENPESRTRFWAAARIAGHIEWRISGPLTLQLGGGALVPLVRDDLVFRAAPDAASAAVEPVYRAPPVAGFARADVGVRFP